MFYSTKTKQDKQSTMKINRRSKQWTSILSL